MCIDTIASVICVWLGGDFDIILFVFFFFFKQKTAYDIGLGFPAEPLFRSIEACGISTLSQSPMLGFHKQKDNRIKLLEEILSFRMQGVEFDNGDMYVDGHKAASDVRDEFVSVTEKLMDELDRKSVV